jgi:cyclase
MGLKLSDIHTSYPPKARDAMHTTSGLFARCFFAALLSLSTSASADEHGDAVGLDTLLAGFGWDFDSAQVTTEKVTDDLYVLFGLGGNIAVSIGEDGVLLVDDQFPQLMDKIKAAITALGGDDVDFVINTHGHFDHADGNLSLGPDGAMIVSHHNARALMASGDMVDLVVAKYQPEPYPKEALPVVTYDSGMQIHFNGSAIQLKHFSHAHTNGDTAVFFPEQNVVHLGDVFNNAGYPFVDVSSGGTIDGMIAFCEQTLALIDDKTVVIPGHGPLTDAATLARYIDMLKTVRSRVAAMIAEGKSLEEVVAAAPTADFDVVFGPESASLGFVNRVYTSLSQ